MYVSSVEMYNLEAVKVNHHETNTDYCSYTIYDTLSALFSANKL